MQKKFSAGKWILFITIGWLTGIALLIIVSIPFESFKIKIGSQALSGICMAAGAGFMQWLILKKLLHTTASWIWFSLTGFAIPFIFFDVLAFFINIQPEIHVPIAAGIAGILCVWLQCKYSLKCSSHHTKGWIIFSFVGWFGSAMLTMLIFRFNMTLDRYVAIPLAFAALFIGDVMLGSITSYKVKAIITQKNAD